MPCRPSHYQKKTNNQTKAVVVTPDTEPCINRLDPSLSSHVTTPNWKGRGKNNLCPRFPSPTLPRPWSLFWFTGCGFITIHVDDLRIFRYDIRGKPPPPRIPARTPDQQLSVHTTIQDSSFWYHNKHHYSAQTLYFPALSTSSICVLYYALQQNMSF